MPLQNASCVAVSAKPSGSIGMSFVVPPEPVFMAELPLLTWYSGPVYVFESARTMLYAATHGVLAAA